MNLIFETLRVKELWPTLWTRDKDYSELSGLINLTTTNM